MFGRKKLDSWAKKIDKLITWIIIGSAIASIFGLSQTKKGKEITKDVQEKVTPIMERGRSWLFTFLGKLVGIFSKKK